MSKTYDGRTTEEVWVQPERAREDPAGKHVDGFRYAYVACPNPRPSVLSCSCSRSFGEVMRMAK